MSRDIAMAAAISALLVLFALVQPANSQSVADPQRGQLLYETHCIACHTARVHWRDARLATDWKGLRLQVERWQSYAGLGWNDDDMVSVAAYLNNHYYNFTERN